MREIKFRIYFRDDESFMSEPISLNDLLHEEWIEFENLEGTLSLPLKDFRFYYYKGSKAYELMQYTGLHDKNGKEIYEGDILEITRQYIYEKGQIIFKNGCFFIKSKENLLALYNCELNNYELKIIGNIYENLGLLEKEGIKDE